MLCPPPPCQIFGGGKAMLPCPSLPAGGGVQARHAQQRLHLVRHERIRQVSQGGPRGPGMQVDIVFGELLTFLNKLIS